MRAALPKGVSPHRLAASGEIIEGTVPIAGLGRLVGMLANSRGEINARLEFGRQQGRDVLRLSIDGVLALQCQRCLGEVQWPLHSTALLELVTSETGAERIAEPAEPCWVTRDALNPWQVVEDEAILSLPVIARHDDPSRCGKLAEPRPAPDEQKPNPFAVLKDWKKLRN